MKNKIKQNLWALVLLMVFARPLVFAIQADNEQPPGIDFEDETESDDDAPPGIKIDLSSDDDDDDNKSDGTLKITKDSADPQSFNPSISSTKISYTISGKGIVEIKILDSLNQNVATLVNDMELDAGKHSATWKGTKNNKKDGEIVKAGTYKYKIILKSSFNSSVKDTAEDEITVKFFDGNSDGNVFDDEFLAPVENKPVDKKQSTAVQVMQNNFKGTTSKTGPDVMIYAALPIIGFLAARKKIF